MIIKVLISQIARSPTHRIRLMRGQIMLNPGLNKRILKMLNTGLIFHKDRIHCGIERGARVNSRHGVAVTILIGDKALRGIRILKRVSNWTRRWGLLEGGALMGITK